MDAGVEQRGDVGLQRGVVDGAVGVEGRGDGGDDAGEAHGQFSWSRVM